MVLADQNHKCYDVSTWLKERTCVWSLQQAQPYKDSKPVHAAEQHARLWRQAQEGTQGPVKTASPHVLLTGRCMHSKALEKQHRQAGRDCLQLVSEPPEDSAKDEAHSQSQEEPGAIVLRHAPVDCHVLGEDGSELHRHGLGVLVIKLQLLAALLGTAVLLQQGTIVPGHMRGR